MAAALWIMTAAVVMVGIKEKSKMTSVSLGKMVQNKNLKDARLQNKRGHYY